ncbi:MAG: hypothetical protein HQ567_29450 [Candidatus Nealsonbacteria bacterium]|nr:hypothetical protein [Candidatus Nealsonbacteria bacterium]
MAGEICWRLSPTTAVSSPIPAVGGWSIASPLAIDRDGPLALRHLMSFADGTVLFTTTRLVFVADDDAQNLVQDDGKFPRTLPQYLNALRVVSGQPGLPRSITALTGIVKTNQLKPPTEIPPANTKGFVRRYIADSALTLDHLDDASDAVINDVVPVHGELINDAAESIIRSNFRSAIIFSAAAVEACAGNVLDREYDRLVGQLLPSTDHRRITIQVNQQESVDKDPIYLALRNGTGDGGSRFLTLLHESPLYLLRRSLKVDEPETYRQAHSLYRTRNSLAHTGTTDAEKSGLLDVNYKGAIMALTTANSILNWFGEKGTCVPNDDMVEVDAYLNT